MLARGKCDFNCRVTCDVNLKRIFREFNYAKNKEAVVVWRMREAVASTMEGDQTEGKPDVDVFGQPKYDNVFQFLAEELDERKA